MIGALAACGARDMANEPGNYWTPSHFAEAGRELARKHDLLTCKVLEKAAMKKMGMGGIIGVNQGSAQPPKMVILQYKNGGRKAPILLLVGKGLTFDSGGISLKPGAGMQDMKFDMCGGAAVMGVMQAVAELEPRLNVTAIIPSTDNMPGPEALKPGDVIGLEGDLGSGKTALVRGLAEGLNIDYQQDVNSPTFTLVNLYKGDKNLYHIDLYRLTSIEDAIGSGLFDILNDDTITAIEWVEKIQKLDIKTDIYIKLAYVSEYCRKIEIFK